MRDFSLRSDVQRAVIDGFALPLGIDPGDVRAPRQGYTVSYTPSQDDEPDTYSFHVVVSHERLRGLLERAFDLLPERVYGIVEIDSRDAYRSVDVFVGQDRISRQQFLETWRHFEPFLLEDGSIAAGAHADEAPVEVFLDQWKGLSIHVPLPMREDVESLLHQTALTEVSQTWPDPDASRPLMPQVRPVLDVPDEYAPDVDELLLQLRRSWALELNVDPDSNLDDAGRDLGLTLWCAVAIAESAVGEEGQGAYLEIWISADSLREVSKLIAGAIKARPQWRFSELYSIDRVAYDERPDALAELPPRPTEPQVHLVRVDPWTESRDGDGGG